MLKCCDEPLTFSDALFICGGEIMKKNVFLFIVDVIVDVEIIEASFVYDPDSAEFRDFEDDILDAFDLRGYELEDEMYSDRNGSKSRYYMFTKVVNNEILEVLVKLRVSDHMPDDRIRRGQTIKQKDLSKKFAKDYADKLIERHYPNTKKYKIRNINILFNDVNYQSYDEALNAITDKLDSIH